MEASTSPVTPIYTILGHDAPKKEFFMMCRDCAEAAPLPTSCVPSDAEMSQQEAGGRSEAASGFSAAKSSEADQISRYSRRSLICTVVYWHARNHVFSCTEHHVGAGVRQRSRKHFWNGQAYHSLRLEEALALNVERAKAIFMSKVSAMRAGCCVLLGALVLPLQAAG